jgi:hypothetical protein
MLYGEGDERLTGSMRKLPPIAWGAILVALVLAFPTWKFGLRFLRQFWISPFQFFILPLWLMAYISDRTGVMWMRSGPSLRREENPRMFRQNVWSIVIFGAVMFVFNLCISWAVVSR